MKGNSAEIGGLETGSTYSFIVQPISYTEICDNVYGEYSVSVTVGAERISGDVNADGSFDLLDAVTLQKWLLLVPDTSLADWKAGDLDADDTLDVFDLAHMKKVLLS